MESGRISNFQAAMLTITSLTIMGHLILLTLVIQESKQDGWIASFAGASMSLLGIFALTKLAQRFPRTSFIEILFHHFSWFGKLIGVLYLLYFFVMTALAVKLFAETYKTIMRDTPTIAFITVIVLLSAYVIYLGLETMARMNQILLPVLVLTAIMVVFVTLHAKDYSRLLPIMGNGLFPVFHGAVSVFGWFGEFVVMSMILPYVQRPEKLLRTNLLAATITCLFFIGPITGPIATFGSVEASNMVFPTFSEVRYAHIGKYIDRLDLIAVLFWTVGLTFRAAIFFYALCLGTAQIFHLNTYRPLIIPFGWLVGMGALWFSTDYYELNHYLFHAYVPISIVMGSALPILIGFIVYLKKRKLTS